MSSPFFIFFEFPRYVNVLCTITRESMQFVAKFNPSSALYFQGLTGVFFISFLCYVLFTFGEDLVSY
nr:MAG TPA: hypothetical protein [Caudoviricetes sp.]